MKSYRFVAVAAAAAFIALSSSLSAETPLKRSKISKAALKTENTVLRAEIDSLKSELAKYQEELYRTDSIANELLSGYDEDGNSCSAINIEYTPEVSDSLLHIWYAQKFVSEEEIDMEGTDTAAFKSNIPDSVYIRRIEQMNSFISLPYNDIVKNHIIDLNEDITEEQVELAKNRCLASLLMGPDGSSGVVDDLGRQVEIDLFLNVDFGIWQKNYSC